MADVGVNKFFSGGYMRQVDMYICHPFRGKCKQYNRPKFECYHAKPHVRSENVDDDCYFDRDIFCGGICRKIKMAKSTSQKRSAVR